MGLLKAFDPDFLINLTGVELRSDFARKYEDRIARPNQLVKTDERSSRRYIQLGFNIIPILQHIYEKEIRTSTEPSRATIITAEDSNGWSHYVAFTFGTFSELPETDIDFRDIYLKTLHAREIQFEPSQSTGDFTSRITQIEVTAYDLRLLGKAANFSSHIIYIGDHNSTSDLIEFWNIRATGRTAWFIPVEHYQAHEPMIRHIASLGQYPINPHIENHADLQKGPSIPEDSFREICQWIDRLDLGDLLRRSWSPKFGREMERYVGDIHVAEVEAQTGEEISILQDAQMTPVKLITPKYLDEDVVWRREHCWSIVLSMRGGYLMNDWMFHFPNEPNIEEVVRRYCLIGSPEEVRIGRSGVVMVQDNASAHLHLMPVPTKKVFAALFEQAGLKSTPSQPGRYAEQIIQKMGSLQFDCRIFKLRGVREVVHRLSRGSTLTQGNMHQIIMSTEPDDHGWKNWCPDLYNNLIVRRGSRGTPDFGGIFEEMLDKKVIRPGFIFKCQNCFKRDWYHVSEFDEQFTCRFCFSKQNVHFSAISEWQYKSDGLFQIRDSAQGSLAVIISLWRLGELQNGLGEGRYITSINLKEIDGSRKYEIDFAYLQLDPFSTSYELVLGEARGFNDYKEKDIQKTRELADRFAVKPYLVFSTLKDEFSKDETQLLKGLVTDRYKVIALSRLELDPYHLYDRFENAPQKYTVNLHDLSVNTIHLNLN